MLDENYFLAVSNHEWLLTDGLGGYALGTGNLINQRKYHSLLTCSDENGYRNSLLAGLEILIEWRGVTFHIDSTNYSSCIYPEGFLHLVKSWLRPYPVFLYSSLNHNKDILILMELMMADRNNILMVRFTNLGNHKLHLHIRPKLTLRNHHWINPAGCWDSEPVELYCKRNFFSVNRINNSIFLHAAVRDGEVKDDRIIFRNCYHPWEAIRGYHAVEDLFAPVIISFDLQVANDNYLLFSGKEELFQESDNSAFLESIASEIRKKYHQLPLPSDSPHKTLIKKSVAGTESANDFLAELDFSDSNLFSFEDYLKLLEFSLKDFLIEDNIIAGYPWFGNWGRDTFITLEAVYHLPQIKASYIEDVFNKYGKLIKGGLLPNMLPESGDEGNYDSIDSCLWYVIRFKQFIDAVLNSETASSQTSGKANSKYYSHIDIDVPPESILSGGLTYSHEIITGLLSNQNRLFHIAEDGLLYLTEDFSAATWMDAKIDGKAVTPRTGAPVEINALLYNALCSYRDIVINITDHISCTDRSVSCPNSYSDSLRALTQQFTKDIELVSKHIDSLHTKFQDFFTDDYLADRIVAGNKIEEYRPNAIIAASLPYPLIPQKQLQKIVETAKRELLTLYGLRSLSPGHYLFKKKYLGNQFERDSQYHQGTVWGYLLSFYVQSYCNAYKGLKNNKEFVSEFEEVISRLREEYIKGYIASVAEIWDGHRPRVPKGCPAQAWSVASLYLIESLILRLTESSP